jgi:peptide/nickel transport system permease protein
MAEITQNEISEQDVSVEPFRVIAWRRFRRNKFAVVGLIYVTIFFIIAAFAYQLAPYAYDKPLRGMNYKPPGQYTHEDRDGNINDYTFVFGTDANGRDIFSRIIISIQNAVIIAIGAVVIGLVIGSAIGAIAGMSGGMVDQVLMRAVDIFTAFPRLLLAVVLVSALGQEKGSILLVLGLTGWAGFARLVRGEVLRVKNLEYIEAARSLGASTAHIVWYYIFPNILGVIIVQLTFSIPWAMMAEAGISVIGLGIRPPEPSWGNLLNIGIGNMLGFPYMAIWPALTFSLTLLAFTFVGDGLQEVFRPRGDQ